MITYAIEVSACWLLFYAFYALLLSKETFFSINRWYLLSTLLLGLLIPVFTVDFITFFYSKPASGVVYLAEGFSEMELVIEDSVQQAQTTNYSWLTLVQLIYLLGLGIAFYKLLHGFQQIYGLYQEGTITKKGTYNLVLTTTPHLPFSFFNYLFWNEDTVLEEQDSGKILSHELAHINQWHSLDVLFLEFLSVLLWFSPPIYWYKKSLRTVHEYLADAYVLRNTKKKQYGHLLIRQVQSGMQISLANNFIHSQLKQRIKMMTRHKSRRKQLMRYLPALPLLFLMVIVFANKKVQQNLEETTAMASLAVAKVFENDTPPIFPGGERAMLAFIYKNIRYPATARKEGIFGNTKLQFVVEADGTINNPQIVSKIGGGIEEDILRVFQLMQDLPSKWMPATVDGKAIKTTYELPFDFRLEGYEPNGKTLIKPKEIDKKGTWITVTGLYVDAPRKTVNQPLSKNTDIPTQTLDGEKVFKVVDQMPRFPGCDGGYSPELKNCGDQKMLEYIYTNIKYPKAAREAGIQGTVVIRFLVRKDGTIDDAEILRNVGGGTGEEALRVVNLMKAQNIKWVPGRHAGKAVTVNFNLPIKFKLADDINRGEMTENFEDKVLLKDGEIYTGDDKDISKTELTEMHLIRKEDIIARARTDNGEKIYRVVQQMPLFPGCAMKNGYNEDVRDCANQKMLNYIYENVKYPKAAHEAGVEGTVVIRFMVKKDGSIDDATILRNVGAGIGEEALRVVNLMKEQDIKWIAGQQDGKVVNVYFNLPIKFKLAGDEEKKACCKDGENGMAQHNTKVENRNDPTKFNLSGDELTVNAYPNPAKDHVNVTLKGNVQDMLLTIFDMNGKEYARDYLGKFNGTLNKNIELNGISGGMLIINVRHKGKDYQKKVVVQ